MDQKVAFTMVVDPLVCEQHYPVRLSNIPHHSPEVEVKRDIEFDDHTLNMVVDSLEEEDTMCVGYNMMAERMLAVLQWCTYCSYVVQLLRC